jgi:hypothetical protein
MLFRRTFVRALMRTGIGPFGIALLGTVLPSVARAEEPAAGPDQQQIESWLESEPASADLSAKEAPEAPPPPPRKHGFVVESSFGLMGNLGAMRHVTPTMPWFRTAFGWEPTKWLMLLAQGDIATGSTNLASAPPAPRGFALWAVSGAVRFGIAPTRFLGISLQGEIGATRVTEDVLRTYGFADANSVGPYFGALLGVEWYQVSPHLALVGQAGLRSYGQIFDRPLLSNGPALAWIGAAALKYTF